MKRCLGWLSMGLLALCLVLVGGAPAWAQMGQRPDDGDTKEQPFAPGTAGSANFRIPAMVSLDDGTIVAATDARWNTGWDGGGLDTIVSSSRDGGKSWRYTIANYLGDNGNCFSELSTAFIDPALATDGRTVYMVVDLFPAGIALNGTVWKPQPGQAFDEAGNLRLRDAALVKFDAANGEYDTQAAKAEYGYYLDMADLVVKRAADGTVVDGYTIDRYFNITTRDTGAKTNLFCSDSPFQVFPTNYLYMTSSSDGGLTWGAPTLINAKRDAEQTLLIGPGTGSVLADGTIMFSVYEHTSGREESSVVWSTDQGKSWNRSASATSFESHWSSEAVTVEIDGNTVRQFYRDGRQTLHYTDYTKQSDGSWKPGTPVNTGAAKTMGNQLSAIKLTNKVEGKDAIAVSTATAAGKERKGGKLYIGLVNDDKTMTWRYAYDVVAPEVDYGYSTIAELEDGSISVLYEASWPNMIFKVIPKADIICPDTDLALTVRDVDVVAGESVSITDPSGDHTGSDVSALDSAVATVKMTAVPSADSMGAQGSQAGFTGEPISLKKMLWDVKPNGDGTCVVSSTDAAGGIVYLHPADYQANSGYPLASTPQDIVFSAGADANTLYMRAHDASEKDKAGYLFFWRDGRLAFDRVDNPGDKVDWQKACSFMLYAPVRDGEKSSAEIPGYVRVDVTDPASPSGKYLIVAKAQDGKLYTLYPTTSRDSKRSQAAEVLPNTSMATTVVFNGVAKGEASVTIGTTHYKIHVSDYREVDVSLDMDGTKTIIIEGKDLTSKVDSSNFDEAIASFSVTSDAEGTKITLDGKKPGETVLVVGSTRYKVKIAGAVIDVALRLGANEHAEYFVPGSYGAIEYKENIDSIAGVRLEPAAGAMVGNAPRDLGALEYVAESFDGGIAYRGVLADGKGVYLNPLGKPGYPYSTDPVRVDLASSPGDAGTFSVSTNGHTLFFWRDGGNNGFVFDRVTSTGGFERGISLTVFRKATDDEIKSGSDTVLKGYMPIERTNEITPGTAVLIGAKSGDGVWYMLNPSTSATDKTAHVGKVVDSALTKVVIDAKAAGSGSFRVGDVRYSVTIEPAQKPATHVVEFVDGKNGTSWSVEVADGERLVRPEDPAHEGFLFKGWSLSADEYLPVDFDAPVNAALKLFAWYEKDAGQTTPPAGPVDPDGQTTPPAGPDNPDGNEGKPNPPANPDVPEGQGNRPPADELIPATGDGLAVMSAIILAFGMAMIVVGKKYLGRGRIG